MPDPDVAIPVLSGAALAQGIAFLYGQAAELLRFRREDKTRRIKSLRAAEAIVSSGPRVRQSAADVRGTATGMRIRGAGAKAAGEVVQRFETVHQGGEAIGVDIDLCG